MSGVCVLLADGFEEIEAVAIIDVLRRAELAVTIVGTSAKSVTGSHGIRIEADTTLEQRAETTWDAVVLPGGLPGATNLRDDERVQALLRRQHAAARPLAAICAAPIALGAAGVLDGRRATCYPGFEDGLHGARASDERVVVDGHIITSRGPGTAIEFALALVARLKDERTARQLEKGMLVRA